MAALAYVAKNFSVAGDRWASNVLHGERVGELYTAGTAFLEALKEAGVSFVFANLGSDHPAIVDLWTIRLGIEH